MYIIQNALENLVRNKGRNILISVIIFAIIATTVVALIINNTASAVIEDYSSRFGSKVSINPDTQKIREEAMANSTSGRVSLRMPAISPELLLSFAESDTLQKTEAYGSISANSDDIRAIDQDDSEDSDGQSSESAGRMSGAGGMVMSVGGSGGNYPIYGDYWDDFNDGSRALTDDGVSEFPSGENECVISTELAEENGIEIGDVITFTAQMSLDIPSDIDMSGYEEGDTFIYNDMEYTLSLGMDETFRAARYAEYKLTVTGIYYDLTDEYSNENMPKMASLNRRNEILTTLDTLLSGRSSGENNINLVASYYLKNPGLLDEFESYVRAAGLSDSFIVSADSDSYNTIVKPVLSLKSISVTFMVIVLVLGAVILILLTSIAIRERKYEIGVLRAMGMKKSKVSMGLWAELLIMTCICLVIGIGAGALAAQPVTDALITQQAEAASSSSQNDRQGFSGGMGGMMMSSRGGTIMNSNSSNAEPLSEMEITIGLNTVLEIIGIALLLATAAGLVSASKITKYEPIKILMERN